MAQPWRRPSSHERNPGAARHRHGHRHRGRRYCVGRERMMFPTTARDTTRGHHPTAGDGLFCYELTQQRRDNRGTEPGAGPRHAEGGRLHRRRPAPADHRGGEHVDRDRSLQLPPARPRRGGEGGHPGSGRDADGVQHGVDLRRHHDGQRGNEGLARQPRGRGRLHRAGRARQPVRRHRDPGRLRQDNPRRGDGPGAVGYPGPGALRRFHRARALGRARRHDSGRVRGGRRPCGRQDDRRAASCP